MRIGTLSIIMGFILVSIGYTQPVLTPKNMALGGGGSTYITDYNANFYNPANLHIRDRKGRVNLGFLITGTYFNPVQSFSNLDDQRKNFTDYLVQYKPGSYSIGQTEKKQIIDHNYSSKRLTSPHQSRFEATLFGVHWKNKDNAYSIAMRTRTSSTFEVGRNWYSIIPVTNNDVAYSNQTLRHRYQTLHEISFGYAESIDFFNQMSSRLENFIIGIAPKLVLGGAYQNANWKNIYSVESEANTIQHAQEFEYAAVGRFKDATEDYLGGTSSNQAIQDNINPISDQIFDIYGIGAGLDIGLTYLLTLGKDLSALNRRNEEIHSSLRISVSVTDIGFVSYKDDGISYNSGKDTTIVSSFPSSANDAFIGAPGQFLAFADQFAATNPFKEFEPNTRRFSVLLPTALHSGILLELNRVKVSGDISMGLTNSAFNSKKLVASFGVEIRPLKFLPLRAGTQLASELPGYISLGTALETRYWDFSIATQLSMGTYSSISTFTGLTVAALQFHL